ncbi:phosphodiesterase [Kitasatospora sp. NBC_01287]|uniref:phosphodiesterase n=1 Tax=Kitasatospora sp. NBC_01287 TaxID=2903573 RepID=UPI002250B4EB|nr:phosphodiesterase [Kitasatospora sp. NBC_01287]MCX4750144.1 phosphodiesterase [Kitasatospora sp. NBC_01287]
MSTLAVAHLSDTHITTGPLAAEPATGLYRALGRILALDPRPGCVVITGDLTEAGRPEEYAALREVMAGFPLPLHLVAGNHDDPEALVAAFGGTPLLGGGKDTHYLVEHDGLSLVVLDSRLPGSPAGQLGPEQLAWLDQVLAARPEVPAVVCVHHPPIALGIPFMDGMRLENGPELAAVLARHPRVVRVLAGHLHRAITAPFAGSTLAVAPSTYRQSTLTLREDRQMGYLHEPTAFLLHLPAEGTWVTHTVPVSGAAELTGAF